MTNEQLRLRVTNDINSAFPEIMVDDLISFNRYSMKNQIRVYRKIFTYVFEFLGLREAEYEYFESRDYIDILYKVAEYIIIKTVMNESKEWTADYFKEKEREYASKFGIEIFHKYCNAHNL